MRKKILLMTFLTLLLTAMGTGALYAQDNVVTIDGTVGGYTSTKSMNVPIYNNEDYAISQQYYLADEIAKPEGGTITSIAFQANEDAEFHITRKIKIYIVNTSVSSIEYSSRKIEQLEATSKVFEGEVLFSRNAWHSITLDTPFEYSGGNILLCVVDDTGDSETSEFEYYADYFKCFTDRGGDGCYRSYYAGNHNNTKYDPTASTSISQSSIKGSAGVPCVQFTFEAAIKFEGEGTATSPYIIADIDDLSNLRKKVNEGEAYEGKYFELTSDITLTEAWTPIGTGSRSSKSYSGNAFKGTFDGGDHTISGLTITSTSGADAAVGLFGIVDGGTVKNLNLTDVNINVASSNLAGAAIGMMLNGATADYITVSGAVVGHDGVGGIVGRLIIDGTIANCTNNANVTSSYGGIGGIVGKAYYEDGANTSTFASIEECINTGTITAPMYVGGIVGLTRANVTNCVNEGAVVGGTQTGGIVGQLIAAGTVSGNENKAKVSGKNHLGGIIGDYSQSSAYTYYNVSIANNINRGELAATEQCAAIMGCNNIDGFDAMTATGNVSYYYVEGLELFGNPEDMVIDATNKFILPVAKIDDVEYSTLAEAVEAAKSGDEIIMLSDAAEDVTIPAGITFNGKGRQINGNIVAAGDLTFVGHTKVTSFNAGYNKPVITISEGACLEITGTGRMVIGHGATFNITGTIAEAKTANVAELTPSLIMPGASFTGAGVTFNVTNAYISAPSSYCSSSSSASGTFDFNIENSIWESAGKLAFESQSTAATVNFDLVESVLNTGSHLVFGVSRGEVVIDNSNVNVGTSRQIENQSTMTIKNGSVVNGAVATSSNAKNPGTIIVEDATYAVTGEFSGSDLGTGTLIVKKGATVSAGSITKANIQIDATGMAIGDVINLTANLTNLAGTLEVINNDNLDAEIKDGKIVLVEKPVAKIGETEYATLQAALNAAAQTEELTTIQLLAGTHTFGNVKFPATLKSVTIVGADNKATIIKDSKLYSADGNAVTYKGITFDGIVFDNSSILFTGARNGEVVYEDWTIKKCDFRNLQSTDGIAAIHFNLAADETIKNFTFEDNTITNVTSPSNTASGLRLNYVTGNVVIKDNETNNVAFNAVQIINSEVDNFTFEGNILRSNGSSLANLYNVTGENIVITKNQFLANEDQKSVSNIAYADVSGNYWGGGAPTNLPEGVVYSSYYTTVESDGTLGGLVELPQGNDFTGYTRGDAIWGEVWGNAKESFVIKVLDANGNVMGTTSLNNVGGIINGNVNVTWSLKLDAASNTDEYWTMEWTTAPTIDNMPAKVELWVDGVKVSGGNVVLNGPDEIAKIYAAVTDASGKILGYHTDIQEAIKAAAAVTSVAKTATAGTVEILRDVTVDKWIMFSETLNISSGQIITMNIDGLTINGNGKTVTIKSIESAGNGNRLFYDATNLNIKDLTINYVDAAANQGGIGLTAGTIENVTFNGGGNAILPGTGDITVKDCTFKTNGTSIYYEAERDNLVVTGNTFENPDNVNVILLRGNTTFTDNTVISGRTVNVVSGSPVVSGNNFNDVRLKVYNEATATISDNEINNLVFNETTSPAASTFANNTLSEEAQAAIDALPAIAGEGTEANPYTIGNLTQLKAFRDDVNAGNDYKGKFVKLTADIDLNNEEWTPIGNNTKQFQGYFDGNEKTISNLKISGNNRYVGLFGYIKGQGMSASTTPSVKDLTLENVNVSGDHYVGGLSGQAYTCNITNVTVKGEVSGVRYVGGLVGHVYTYFKDCHFIGDASCSFDALGGIAGAGDCRAYDCSVIGDITGSNWVGGIVGNGQEGTSAVGCYVKGDVKTSTNWYFGVGGIAGVAGHGYSSSEFKNNYFDGEVYLEGEKVPAMIIGIVNAENNETINATIEGNSWNTTYYDVNIPVYVTAEAPQNGTTENWIAGASEDLTKPRNNNLVMLESDLQYVTEEDYVIMSFSEVTEGQVEQALINNAVAKIGETTYTTLQKALDAAVAGTGNVTVEILRNIDLTGIDWNPVTVSGPGYPVVTVNGNNDTITGLNDMLFAGTWAGNSGLIINDLTIANSNIVNDENDANGNIGVGAFIGFPQASETITLNNCHLVNSTVKGGHWTGGLIGMAGGYNGNDGPVFMNLTITGCSVTGSTITGKGSVGGIIGHGSCAAWTSVDIDETTVSGNTITSIGSSNVKAGAIMGTIGAAGQPTTANDVTLTGGATVSATVAGNTVTSGGTTITTIYGRQGTPTGMLELAGGSYDNYPIEENVAYAAPVEGYKIEENGNGTYGVVVDPAYGKVAKIGDIYYETLAEAFTEAAQTEELTTIELLPVTIEEDDDINTVEKTIKLPATLKNVIVKGADNNTSILKNLTIQNAQGGTYDMSNITFDGVVFDNSNIVLTGWRTGFESLKNLIVKNCVFRNIVRSSANLAAVHINVAADKAVNGFTFINNVIDGVTGAQNSGIYGQFTGEVIVEDNVINNVAFRPYVIQLTTDDGIADNFTVTGNTFSGSAAGRAQGLGNNAEGTDAVTLTVSNNIFKGITDAQQICYWNFNEATTTATLEKNYYDIDVMANPNRIYYNSAAQNITDLSEMGIFPIYTVLKEDGTINEESLFNPVAYVGTVAYETLAEAFACQGGTIVLLEDIELTEGVVVAADKTFTLDLNGKVVSGVSTTAASSSVITNNGNLTVQSSVEGGKITSFANNPDPNGTPAYANNTITNCGVLTLVSGTIENSTVQGLACYPIDNNSTLRDAIVNIQGGVVTGRGAIRQFANSETNKNEVNVTGGQVIGTSYAIWIQNPSNQNSKDVKAALNISDGELGKILLEASAAYEIAISGGKISEVTFWETDDTNPERNASAFITGGTFDGDVSAYCAFGYTCQANGDGTYGIVETTSFEIPNLDRLTAFRNAVNAGNTFAGQTVTVTADINMESVENWTPIGTLENPFNGTFDGGNKTISNLNVNGGAYVGLFGYADNATIKNVKINNANVKGTNCVGVIAGNVYSTSLIDNCHVSGNIKVEGNTNVGGIVGKYYTKVKNSSVIGDEVTTSYVKGVHAGANLEGDNIGGIMGHAGENNTHENNVVKNITISGTRKVGGLIGVTDQNTDVTNCVVENVKIETTAEAQYAEDNKTKAGHASLVGSYTSAGANDNGTVTNCLVKNVEFVNTNNVVASFGPITGGARGGSEAMLNPTGVTASGNTVYTTTVTGSNNLFLMKAVAKIDETDYYTLDEAIAAANNQTVTVLENVELRNTLTIEAGKTVTLDLNGKNLTGGANVNLYINGELTIEDNVGNAVSTFRNHYVSEGGKLTLKSGILQNIETNTGGYGIFIENGGESIIEGGTVQAVNESNYAICVNGKLTIVDGNIVGKHGVIAVENPNAIVTIKDGEYTLNAITGNSDHIVYVTAGMVNIEGGNFTFNNFIANEGDSMIDAAEENVSITGGTYTQDVNEWCAEGYAALPDLNGNYIVGVKPTATVNNLGMTTVAAGDYMVYGSGNNTEDMPLSFVMQFLADQDAEEMEASPFAEWYGDFVITFTGIENGSFTADGCYLAGHYGSFGWVKVPVDGMTIEAGVRYPVMLGVGMGQKYDYICSSVEDFKCALYLTDEILAANPNIQVNLELAIVDDSQGSDAATSALVNNDKVYSVTDYTYDAEDFMLPVAKIGDVTYTSLQKAVDYVAEGETIVLIDNIEQADGVIITDKKNIIIDLNEKTFTVTEGANTNNRNFKINGTSVVTIKNGTMVAAGDYNSGAYGTVRTEGSANVTLTGLKLYNYRGNGLNIKALDGTTVAIDNTEIYSQYGGGIEAAGGTITLAETVKVEQKGMYIAPYNSMAISVNGGGTVTVAGGTYSTECITAEEANNQGSSHGPWVVGVLNSGGTLIINGGTFSNDNFGDNSLATAARGAVLADTGAEIEINGGTFNALKAIIDIQNNLGDSNNNPSALLSGGTFSADPRISAMYGSDLIVVAQGYELKPLDNGYFTVIQVATTLTRELAAGWSWFSSYVDTDLDGLKASLEGDGTREVRGKVGNRIMHTKYNGTSWGGTLNTFFPEQMYMIESSQVHTMEYYGEFIEDAEIVLYKGWNWIAYPLHTEMTLKDALANFTPAEGDIIKNKEGEQSIYYSSQSKWYPEMTLVPGEGYMYSSNNTVASSFVYSTVVTTPASRSSVANVEKHWSVDTHKYPFNMTMTAVFEDAMINNYEIAAFVNGECRGSARPTYIAELDTYLLFLAIHGEKVENVTFTLYDIDTDTEYELSNSINYTNDAIFGSIDNPYVFSRGTTGIGEAAMSNVNIYPNPTTTGTEINLEATCDKVEVFNALGVKVIEYHNVDSIDALETAGIYVIRITNNGNVQNCRLVVK